MIHLGTTAVLLLAWTPQVVTDLPCPDHHHDGQAGAVLIQQFDHFNPRETGEASARWREDVVSAAQLRVQCWQLEAQEMQAYADLTARRDADKSRLSLLQGQTASLQGLKEAIRTHELALQSLSSTIQGAARAEADVTRQILEAVWSTWEPLRRIDDLPAYYRALGTIERMAAKFPRLEEGDYAKLRQRLMYELSSVRQQVAILETGDWGQDAARVLGLHVQAVVDGLTAYDDIRKRRAHLQDHAPLALARHAEGYLAASNVAYAEEALAGADELGNVKEIVISDTNEAHLLMSEALQLLDAFAAPTLARRSLLTAEAIIARLRERLGVLRSDSAKQLTRMYLANLDAKMSRTTPYVTQSMNRLDDFARKREEKVATRVRVLSRRPGREACAERGTELLDLPQTVNTEEEQVSFLRECRL